MFLPLQIGVPLAWAFHAIWNFWKENQLPGHKYMRTFSIFDDEKSDKYSKHVIPLGDNRYMLVKDPDKEDESEEE